MFMMNMKNTVEGGGSGVVSGGRGIKRVER